MFQSDINKELFESIGEVNVPTKVSELENDSNYQSAEQVEQKINDLVNSAPEALDTLKELADALNSDPNFATTVTNQLSNKADKTELDKYLLKTGGVITGDLYIKYANFIMNKYLNQLGYNPRIQFSSQTGTITLINYNTSIDGGVDEESVTKFGPFGVVLNNKTANDLLTAAGGTTTLKTINGQSIFGNGNIEINSDNVYIIDYITKSKGTITEEQYNDIKNAIINNKIIVFKLYDNANVIISAIDITTSNEINLVYQMGIITFSINISSDYNYTNQRAPGSDGTVNQVLTKTEYGWEWKDPQVGDAFPEGGEEGQVLKKTADGVEWANDTDTTYQNATQDTAGLMSGSDKTKLDNLISVPTGGTDGQVLTKTSNGVAWENVQAGSSFPEGGTVGQVLKKTESGTEWANDNNTTYENASQSSAGLMSSADKTKLDNLVEIPSGGTEGQVLKKTSTGVEWSNDSDTIVTVNNTLESDSTTEALSAAQGKALNEKIEALEIPGEYTLPTATSSQLGGVKIGEGITVQSDGTISAADDVVSLTNLYAAKGDIAAMCAAGPFITNLYFINSPVTEGITAGIDTGDYYHLCVKKSGQSDYYETTCSNIADTFLSFDNIDNYFTVTNTVLYLKNNVIYHVTGGTDAGYFVSNEKGDTLTNVASRFETLAEARAYMREKMLALPDIGIVKCTSEEYEDSVKDENTLYIIHG